MEIEKLNTRQWRTYNLIKKNTLEGKVKTQKEIIDNYPISIYSDGYELKESNNTSDLCSTIWRDVETLNFSPEIEKIVIVKKFTYKLAENEQEAEEFAQKFLNDGLKKLKRHWNIIKKIKSDGQGKIISTKGDVIDEDSKARWYCETYLAKELEDDKEISQPTENQ